MKIVLSETRKSYLKFLINDLKKGFNLSQTDRRKQKIMKD